MYPDFENSVARGEDRKDLIREIAAKLLPHGGNVNVGGYGDIEFNTVSSKIRDLENDLLRSDISEADKEVIVSIFQDMRAKFEADPFNFTVDTYCYLNQQLALTGQKELMIKEKEKVELEMAKTDDHYILEEVQAKELASIKDANTSAFKVYNNQDENFAQVMSAANLPHSNIKWIQGGQLAGWGVWASMVWAGTSTLTSLAILPAGLVMVGWASKHMMYDSMETIKDIYLKKEDNTLNVYLWKAGKYSRVLENINVNELQIIGHENAVVRCHENLPFKPKTNEPTVSALRAAGLPPTLIPVIIQGKTHWMDQNFRANKELMEDLNL